MGLRACGDENNVYKSMRYITDHESIQLIHRLKTNRLLRCTIGDIVKPRTKENIMSTLDDYPEYAPIAEHIRRANIERVVPIAEAFAEFIFSCWQGLEAPPRPAAVIMDPRYPWAGIQ